MSLWIDVTTVASCAPPATGIPRVELNLARALLATGASVRICLYESQLGRFSELARDQFDLVDRRYRSADSTPAPALAIQRRDLRIAGGGDVFGRGDAIVACGFNWRPQLGNMARLYAMRASAGLRVITLCYDIIAIKFPHLIPGLDSLFVPYIRDMGRHADHIACISQCTRDDLRQWLSAAGEPAPPISVLSLGCDRQPQAPAAPYPRIAGLLSERFLLCVGTVESRKNQQVLAGAYAHLIDAGVADLPLVVIAGAIGHGGQAFVDTVKRNPRLAGRVLVLSGLSDAELAALYRRCLFTLYPSLYEGWGLPISESLIYGKFCIASERGALTEAGRDFVDYLNPLDARAWAERIRHYLTHPDALAAREADIGRRFAPHTWEQSARHLLAVADTLAMA
jgi:glycosyltransferase involved in cell wall biosynthesis